MHICYVEKIKLQTKAKEMTMCSKDSAVRIQ